MFINLTFFFLFFFFFSLFLIFSFFSFFFFLPPLFSLTLGATEEELANPEVVVHLVDEMEKVIICLIIFIVFLIFIIFIIIIIIIIIRRKKCKKTIY